MTSSSSQTPPPGHALAPRTQRLVLVACALGIALRLYIVLATRGSNDILKWQQFAEAIREHGLAHLYDKVASFNHPPLMGWLAAACSAIGGALRVRFEVLFKLPQVAAEALCAWLIWRSWRARDSRLAALATICFCWNPASTLVAAYHGNTDALCAALVLLAAVWLRDARPLRAGLALGAAINVKLIPVIAIPLLFSTLRAWRPRLRFALGLAACTLPFLPFIIFSWPGFRAHVLGYASYPGAWGVTGLLVALAGNPNLAGFAGAVYGFWTEHGTALILGSQATLALANLYVRRWNAVTAAALALSVWLVITPGFGVQYIVYPVAVLYAARVRDGIVYSMVVGAYAFVLYFGLWTRHGRPLSMFNSPFPAGGVVLGYLAWAALAAAVARLLVEPRPTSAHD